ncbi:MAG: hypothetical protein ACYTG6_02180 [Planctomycetota bacterium]|jgi:hypothetical protein
MGTASSTRALVRYGLVILVWFAVALPACGRSESSSEDGTVASGLSLRVLLDDVEVATVTAGEIGERRPLAGYLPATARDPATWIRLEANSEDRRFLRLQQPAESYKGQEAALYVTKEGWPSIGMFRPDNPALSDQVRALIKEPTVYLVKAAEVHVRTTEPASVPVPPKPALLVSVDGGEAQEVTAQALAALATTRVTESGTGAGGRRGNEKRMQGWSLRDVVRLVVDPAGVTTVRLVSATEATLDVSGEALRGGELHYLLKQNRRGEFNARLVETGPAGPRVTQEFRQIARLEVRTGP